MSGLEQKRSRAAPGHGHKGEISGYQMDVFLDFIDDFMTEMAQCLQTENSTREVPIMVQLFRSHLRGQMETPSSLISASGLARGTAHRIITSMIEKGLIDQRARTRSGKTFSLHPSRKLIEMWFEYARRVTAVMGRSIETSAARDYFLGASYMAGAVIPPLPVLDEKLSLHGSLRILLHADPTFLAMQKLNRQFRMHFGVPIEVKALSLDRLHSEILENASRPTSEFDILTCDTCWMAELIDKQVVQPVEEMSDADAHDLLDFHPEALQTVTRGSTLYGRPVQTTPELFIYRQDLLYEQGLQPPETLEDMLELARNLHDPDRGISGICWNGARGTPVGTTFMMLMADLGQPILDLPRSADLGPETDIDPERFLPKLQSDVALEAAEFLVELLGCSPDNVLQMSWFERAKCYSEGKSAMAYCYTQIMSMFMNDPSSPAHGRTGFAPHPSARGEARLAPLGGWNLCIPANLAPGRLSAVRSALHSLTSASATKLYIENGSTVSSRFSVCNDPTVAHDRPIIPIVDRMARRGMIQAWPRPAVRELNDLVRVLGEEIHNMLLRNKSPRAALRDAQARCDRVMIDSGRYRDAPGSGRLSQ